MTNRRRVYLKDANTGEELGQGVFHANGPYVDENRSTTCAVVLTPIGDTDREIGDQAQQGEFGFRPECREIRADHFPGRKVVVKIWFSRSIKLLTLA